MTVVLDQLSQWAKVGVARDHGERRSGRGLQEVSGRGGFK